MYLLRVALGEVSGKSRPKLFSDERVNEKSGTKEKESWIKNRRLRADVKQSTDVEAFTRLCLPVKASGAPRRAARAPCFHRQR